MSMLVIKENSQFKWPVKAKVPENGKLVEVEFEATFNVLDHDVEGELRAQPKALMKKALHDFEGDVVDANGNAVTDRNKRVDMIISKTNFLDGLCLAYSIGQLGYEEKNSKRP